jgi:tRNA modification GTPase
MARGADPPARVCVLTPAARGAVAVVRVWGPRALEVAGAAFRPARGGPLSADAIGVPRFGRAGAGLGDEVVAVVVGGAVAGGPPEVELHCHGGPAPVELVVEALVAAGAERRRPLAWVRHAAGRAVEAQARADLARATTLRAAEVLFDQAAGALGREVAEAVRLAGSDPVAAAAAVERLRARATVGRRLVRGWTVALAGRPNVGKSRLLNALAGYNRAIVDPSPGTTRDVVTVRTALDGWPVELADTAGLREADDAVESAGIALARARQAGADLTVLVLDRSVPLTDNDRALLDGLRGALVVANKSDLPAAWEAAGVAALTVSAERGDGLDRLAEEVARRLVPEPPPPGAGVPFRVAHARRLERAREALRAGDVAGAVAALSPLLGQRRD